jgi:hypothetical protein
MTVGALSLRPDRGAPSAGGLGPPFQSLTSRVLFTLGASVTVGVAAAVGIVPGIVTLIAVAVALVVLAQPTLGAFALVAVAPAISGLRPGLPLPVFRLSELIIMAFATLILLAARPGRTAPWGAFDWLALAYVLATAALGTYDLYSRHEAISLANLERLLGPFQFFLLYRALRTVLTTNAQRRMALRLLLLASVPVSLLALLQVLRVGGTPRLLADLTGSQLYFDLGTVPRATGPFPHWHDLGGYLFVIVLVGVALLVTGATAVMSRRLLGVVVALAAAGVASTVSFTPIAGTVIGSLFLLPLARRPQRWFGVVALCAVVIAILFGPLIAGRYHEQFVTYGPVNQRPLLPQNLNFRIDVWTTEFVPLLRRHLTTGYGPDVPPNLVFRYTESVYVTLLLRGGLPLLIIYGGLMLALALRARDVKDDDGPELRAIAHVVFLVVVLAVFMQMATNYFVNSGFPFLFWVLAALLTGSAVGPTRQLRRTADDPGKTSQPR